MCFTATDEPVDVILRGEWLLCTNTTITSSVNGRTFSVIFIVI